MSQPRIFLSAVSAEFGGLRRQVADVVAGLGYEVRSQDNFSTGHGELGNWLRTEIEASEGLIQLVGMAYGREPPRPDPQYDRVSYTQFELLHAHALRKKVWVFTANDEVPRDTPAEGLDLPGAADVVADPSAWQQERRALQVAYRERLRALNLLRHPFSSSLELENKLFRMRDDLSALRAEWLQGLEQLTRSFAQLNEAIRLGREPTAAASPIRAEPLAETSVIDRWLKRLCDPSQMRGFKGPWCEALISGLRRLFPERASALVDARSVIDCFQEVPVERVASLFEAIRGANMSQKIISEEARRWGIDLMILAAMRCLDLGFWLGSGPRTDAASQASAFVGEVATSSALIASIGVAGMLGQAIVIDSDGNPDGVIEIDSITDRADYDQAVFRQLYDRLLGAKESRRVNPDNDIGEDELGELWSYFLDHARDNQHAAVFLRISPPHPSHRLDAAQKISAAIGASVIQGTEKHDPRLVQASTGYNAGKLLAEITKRLQELAPARDSQRRSVSAPANAAPGAEVRLAVPLTDRQQPASQRDDEWHVFLSHASEDKSDFVIPLYEELCRLGLKVWLDREQAHAGDVLPEKVRDGLARSRFGVVVLSAHYFDKVWTVAELNALVSRQMSERRACILPVRLGLSHEQVVAKNALVGNLLSLNGADGAARVAQELRDIIARI